MFTEDKLTIDEEELFNITCEMTTPFPMVDVELQVRAYPVGIKTNYFI